MAIEDAVRFLVRASTNAKLKSRLQRSMTTSGIVALAKEHGFSFTEDELTQVLLAPDGELSNKSLEQVSDGPGGAKDVNSLVQYVLRRSYLKTTDDLKNHADKVKHYTSIKKGVRDQLGGWPT